jgi:hypothetical protein
VEVCGAAGASVAPHVSARGAAAAGPATGPRG